MPTDSNLGMHLAHLKYIVVLAFKRYKILYLLLVANLLSTLIEFGAIGLLGMISQKNINLELAFLSEIQKEEVFIIFVSLLLLRFMSLFVLESSIVHYAKEIQVYLSSSALRKTVNENIKDVEAYEIGHYLTLAGDEASNASQVIISVMNIVNTCFLVVVYSVLILVFSQDIMVWLVGLLLVIAIAIRPIYRNLFKLGYDQATLKRRSDSVFLDSLNSLRVVKAFSIENYMASEYHRVLDDYCAVNSKLVIYNYLIKYLPLVLLLLAYGLFVSQAYFDDALYDVAFLITLLFMLIRLLHSIGVLSGLVGKLVGELKGVANIVEFIRSSYVSVKSRILSEKVRQIRLQDLSFAYGSNVVFDGLNLSFDAGKSYAIYGESGAGKSTLLDLIMDYITPHRGQVTINDVDVHQIKEESLTEKIIYVGQESLIFNKTIRENIELEQSYGDEELEETLQTVKLSQMIEQFEDGLEHVLNYRGTNISGGQRQRLNLARALIRKPDVLILDEITSALDAATKESILRQIVREYENRMVIFVTHDPAVLACVDQVFDLNDLKRIAHD